MPRRAIAGESRGFTLVELLTVAALIALLASMAIASLRKARELAIESVAAGSLRTLINGEYQYYSRTENFSTFLVLQGQGDIIDRRYDASDDLTTGADQPIIPFYSVNIALNPDSFTVYALPRPGAPYDLRTFVGGSDGSISVMRNGSLVPVSLGN